MNAAPEELAEDYACLEAVGKAARAAQNKVDAWDELYDRAEVISGVLRQSGTTGTLRTAMDRILKEQEQW